MSVVYLKVIQMVGGLIKIVTVQHTQYYIVEWSIFFFNGVVITS